MSTHILLLGGLFLLNYFKRRNCMDKEIYLQDRLANLAAQTEILWSTLEAIYDAMEREHRTLEAYRGAVRGACNSAFEIKKELKEMVANLDEE